jgi:hypothetical protein
MVQSAAVSEKDFVNLDAVEIKMTLADEHKPIIRQLLPKDLDPQKLKIYFFDTADLKLFNTYQVILRARRKENQKDDSTVKLRRVEPDWTFSQWRQAKGEFKVEGDWVSDRLIRSASFSTEREEGLIQQVAEGKESIEKLFSKEQEKFLEEVIETKLDFENLKVLGPSEVYKWKKHFPEIDEEICLEYWQLENPRDVLQEKKEILEISVKADIGNAQAVRERFDRFLQSHKINPSGKQAPKTLTALEFFASMLKNSKFT